MTRRQVPNRERPATKREAPPVRQGPRGAYSAEQRAEALALVEAHGTAHAHRVTGIPKQTLSRWTTAAGIDTTAIERSRTAAATEASRARAAQVSASTVELLEQHIAQAGDFLATVAGVNALAARLIAATDPANLERVVTLAGTEVLVRDQQAAEVKLVADALATLPLAVRDAEGVLTRAVHDLQLLRGEATERGELLVEFNVPRPTAPTSPPLELDTTEE